MKFEKLKEEEKARPFRVTLAKQSEHGKRCEEKIALGRSGIWHQMSWAEFREGLGWAAFRKANIQGVSEKDFANVVGVTARTVRGMISHKKSLYNSETTVGILARFVGVEVPKKVAQF